MSGFGNSEDGFPVKELQHLVMVREGPFWAIRRKELVFNVYDGRSLEELRASFAEETRASMESAMEEARSAAGGEKGL